MVRQQRASKVHEDTYPLCHSRGTLKHQQDKDEQVKHDLLDPPRYLGRAGDFRGKALSFGVLDWKQFEKTKDTTITTAEGTKEACCSYASAETATSSLELDLSTGVVKRSELDLSTCSGNFSRNMRNDRFSVRSQRYSDAVDADEKGELVHNLLSRKQKASTNKNLVEKEQSNNATELSSSCISPSCSPIFSRHTNQGSETSSRILSEALRKVECQDRRNDVQGESSNPVNMVERNQISVEKQDLLDQKITTLTSKTKRDASPNRRFSFSFSQMGRSFSSKESSSTVPALLSPSQASAKSGPLSSGHSRTRSGPLLKPKTEKIVPTKPRPPTTVHALLQFTLRKGINLFQFVVENNNNVLAATLKKSSDSSTRSYTLYSVKEVTKKSDSWLGRHRKEDKNHPFAHTVIGQMKTVTSFTSDLSTHKSESVLFGVETNEELAAIVQTRSMSQRHSSTTTTTVILPSGVHTLPKDGNAPLPLIDRWKSGGACDCGGWDIGCKLRVLYYDEHIKPHTFSSFQLFDQERDQPAFKMVTHDDELHSVEFKSTISLLEAFFISLAESSHQQNWCEALIGDGPLKRETPARYASNPPVSPIGRV